MPPGDHDIEVALEALEADAAMWRRSSEQLGGIARAVEDLRLSRLQAGLFQLFVDAYEGMVDAVQERTMQGAARMSEIDTALARSAATYRDEEAKNLHAINGPY